MTREKLVCKSCGGTVEMDGTHEILFCPYCGSKELIDDGSSDTVKIVRHVTDTVKNVQKEQNRHKEKMKEVTDNEIVKNRDDNRYTIVIATIAIVVFIAILFFFRSLMPY